MAKKTFHYLVAGAIVGATIICAVSAFFPTLADVASKLATHPASYAVLHSPYLPPYSSTIDQSRAMKVSRSGLGSDLLAGAVR